MTIKSSMAAKYRATVLIYLAITIEIILFILYIVLSLSVMSYVEK